MTSQVTHNGEPFGPRQVYHGRAREEKTGRMREGPGKGEGRGGGRRTARKESYRGENREEQSAEAARSPVQA